MKGRLKHWNLDYNAKHLIILTAKHLVVQLLLERAHRDNLHEGTEYVRNMLQQEYWIIGLRNALRKVKSRCIKCRHRNANPIHLPMADLPRERLGEHVFSFNHTGVDYFVPLKVKFRSSSLWWNLRKTGSKLQEGYDGNLGQQNPQRQDTQHRNVSCRAGSHRKTPDSSKWRPWRFDSVHIKSFLAWTRERECTIPGIQWTLLQPEKIFQNGSSICRHDLEKMDSWISSTMESEIEVVKRTCAKPERRWVSLAIRWLCETLWVQTSRNHCDLHWQRRSCEISGSQNGTWRTKPASREVSASILRWCFRDQKQGRRCWRHFKWATKAIRPQKITFETEKNLEIVKTQKWSKLKIFTSWDRKSVHPPFLEGKTRGTRGYGRQLGLPPNCSGTQRTLMHQTHKCGY